LVNNHKGKSWYDGGGGVGITFGCGRFSQRSALVGIPNVYEGRGGINYSVPGLGDTAMVPGSQGCIKLASSLSAVIMAEKG
jgi:hypothetical protein